MGPSSSQRPGQVWSSRTRTLVWLPLGALLVAALGAQVLDRPVDEWTRLVEAGDSLAADGGGRPSGERVRRARVAYLLAFHRAQDSVDVEHALAVADRLDALGEGGVADHVRRAAATLVEARP